MVYYYILNEHGDVIQLWGQSGTCKASYEYDAFGVERNPDKEDVNPFRYCGEYLDLSSNVYYLRARNYRSTTGRFLTEDTHWNPQNMLYGDNPIKWNEREPDEKDPLGLNVYT
ncbi:RHS repeat-associated core domain-containing protein [Lacrimispora sp.]|uniref:RHS repeat-associated core domain-containing protein n=1 Tax=Lacrimispora sp. TaxID=2719234 RepID=UPI0028A8B73A|nr:RHS repeat-associated core domain-containing protein [Lacrimispora sp.]